MNNTSLYLPFDIWTHIFAMLPVETLAKCRAVCPSWRAYIESPSFISKHRNLYNKQHSKHSHLILGYSTRLDLHRVTNDQRFTTLAFLPPFSAHVFIPRIYGGCNGLFLHDHQDNICLWNPFLRKSLILPPCPIVTPFQFTHYVNYVIGFSTSCDDYKVLAYRHRTINNGKVYEPAMAVYSLRNHIWTIKINPMNADAWTSLRSPISRHKYVYCGWIIYWFTESDPGIIRSFDFNMEEFNNLAVPEPLKECKMLVLFAIDELLAVMSSSCIWILEKYDGEYTWREWCSESWINSFFDIFKEDYLSTIKVLFVEETNTFLMIGFDGRVDFYQVTSGVLGMLRNGAGYFLAVIDYVETLVLLTGTEGMTFQTFP
ncbi:F-box/LRR-repeat/kelch-repeat protein At2g27520-like [Amaranthus tricolor]|uniref:F-box/LRR-repeat/kelch-repeat protein At2g27520-like n=1 Tax=Amaranthus tricolor TaxID=29722 RepID=UPI00258B39CC|nr:F-box/LRR-repeat/kelch-repeat protein At2g27520-like [Amaranthus tricolor]XP_057543462.1 F-box/LRR-repeat/kelch-repeat protein At2g27520-like [Amaranthus tricolor]XP_057543464.1 F-box/LRR-repeat/kelch-repeat protein At2g27520-like [Amaranthus tricolor]XP_057543469.1 F-box/LRR-repeat/kelch-repeat protein At2g27520-like [Amaranthus tricolor]